MVLSSKSCYGPTEKQDIIDIQKWARDNDIESYIINLSDVFKKEILTYFKDAYLNGKTPNPCVMCNTEIKFGHLLEEAQKQGIKFDYFATGHYAQIEQMDGRFILKQGADLIKDQSYFLYRLTQEQLSKTLFPLGSYTKNEVRDMARKRGLVVAEKADSQDFYAGKYSDLLECQSKLGNIVLKTGKILGKHQGFWNYTIGQRKGLGIAYPEPLFVLDINAEKNEVIVGTKDECFSNTCEVEQIIWNGKKTKNINLLAKYRSAGKLVPVIVSVEGDTARVTFKESQPSIARGQSIVFYQGDYVLGGGIIK